MSDCPTSADPANLSEAVRLLRQGRLVAFPTETVYGLGADATNPEAIRKIFQAKGRPSTNPLIVHVADAAVARRYARTWPDAAETLARAFWPGPLTLVLPKAASIVPEVSAGLETVGLRVPDHPLTLELLRRFDGPLAGPSANRSTRVSPTTAQHVRDELGDRVDLVLDGGPCTVGIESTVLDLSGETPAILRPGGVSRGQIEALVGPVRQPGGTGGAGGAATPVHVPARSPGQHEVHYAPVTPAYRFEPAQYPRLTDRAGGFLLFSINAKQLSSSVRAMPRDPAAFARVLYASIRALDAMNLGALYIEMPPDEPAWSAVRDRVRRATRPLP